MGDIVDFLAVIDLDRQVGRHAGRIAEEGPQCLRLEENQVMGQQVGGGLEDPDDFETDTEIFAVDHDQVVTDRQQARRGDSQADGTFVGSTRQVAAQQGVL